MTSELSDAFGLAGSSLEGRYRVDAPVAEGGFAIVYRAQHAALDRPIALKVLKTPEHFDDRAREQFLASFATEAKVIARIAHPSIVQVYDFGVSLMPSGVRAPWMALEWLTGQTLGDELTARRGQGGRSPPLALALVRPILSALAAVHREGIAHRDIKPANVMLVSSPAGVTPKLLDFGIAKFMDPDEVPGDNTRTRSSQIAFSPAYAAPEQIAHARSGPWTDVHAMGLLLSEILTDRAPLDAVEMSLLYQQIVDRTRPTPAKLGVDVGAWESVLVRALAILPAERFRDAGELLGALEATVAQCVVISDFPRRSDPPSAQAQALAVMPTALLATPAPAAAPTPAVTTRAGAMLDAREVPRVERGTRTLLYIAGGAVVAAGLVAAVVVPRLGTSATPAAGGLVAPPVTLALPSASAAATVAPVPSPSSEVTPAPGSSASASPAPGSSASASPAPSATPSASPRPSARHRPPAPAASGPPHPATPHAGPSTGFTVE